MKKLYLILLLSIVFLLFIIIPKPVDNTYLEKELALGISIENQMIKKEQKQARYYIIAYPDYMESYESGLKRDSLFFVYQNNKNDKNRKNYLRQFKRKNKYDYDFLQLDFSHQALQFLKESSKYTDLRNLILDSKINDFRYISWSFPMMKILGSNITFDELRPTIHQPKVFYLGEEVHIPIFLALDRIEEKVSISKFWLNDALLINNKVKIKADEIGKQQFKISIEGNTFDEISQMFEFIVE